ncbi:MAG TPA: hypothetical protein DHV38_05415 [Corynebacterium casei]|nr:hypothetical protein [Corynebacterium casei]
MYLKLSTKQTCFLLEQNLNMKPLEESPTSNKKWVTSSVHLNSPFPMKTSSTTLEKDSRGELQIYTRARHLKLAHPFMKCEVVQEQLGEAP